MNAYGGGEANGLVVAHDERGNTVVLGPEGQESTYTYDVQGHLVGASVPQPGGGLLDETFLYDALERRVARLVHGAQESWTIFVHSKERVLVEEDLSGSAPRKSFVWGGRIDELLVEGIGTDMYAVHLDRLGSVVALSDASGTLVESYEYTPYGTCTATDVDGGGLAGNPYRWTGRRWDSELGLDHLRARAYSPDLGRFLSRDPPGIWNDALNRGNPYAYGGGNPFLWTDPTGEDFIDWVAGVANTVSGALTGALDAVSFGGYSKIQDAVVDLAYGTGTAAEMRENSTWSTSHTFGEAGTGVALVATGGGAVAEGINIIRGARAARGLVAVGAEGSSLVLSGSDAVAVSVGATRVAEGLLAEGLAGHALASAASGPGKGGGGGPRSARGFAGPQDAAGSPARGRTSRAARRDAMRQNNTLTSRATIEQSRTGGRQQTVVEGADGKPRVQTQHPADNSHSAPHWHDGKPKVDPDTGEPIRNRHGLIKDQAEGRSTSEYDG